MLGTAHKADRGASVGRAVGNSGTPSGERNYAMSLNEGGLLPGRRAPCASFARRPVFYRATSCSIALPIRRASPQSRFPFGRA